MGWFTFFFLVVLFKVICETQIWYFQSLSLTQQFFHLSQINSLLFHTRQALLYPDSAHPLPLHAPRFLEKIAGV